MRSPAATPRDTPSSRGFGPYALATASQLMRFTTPSRLTAHITRLAARRPGDQMMVAPGTGPRAWRTDANRLLELRAAAISFARAGDSARNAQVGPEPETI